MGMKKNIKGFLIDLDGVLYVGDRAIDGAPDAIKYLRQNGYKFRFVSNTTRKSRGAIANRLHTMGFSIPVEYIFTPALAAASWLKNNNKRSYYLVVTGDVGQDFPPPHVDAGNNVPDVVIVGDGGDMITYESMNRAFRHLMNGAELLALEKDRYWMAPDGLSLSAGPFVTALEFATGKRATVVGKPSTAFFELALQDMGLYPADVAMIGDDIHTDIAGAHMAGIDGILVRTGKYREDAVQNATVKPVQIIDSIAQLGDLL
jgi:HAD superfamily hydrolase (TIGR01458 family)